ncbi:helix-turn-helix transcriptional regulator [Erwiniaceae bacterium BAC15a-03b]|uniref:Helix-turn-helix transcriptional regulator n=1 Tax=Winslowiella arboricola TaxID=2978220 RepID=A0A9J6PTU1_9GAMM|nr:PAS and helix-turn-helix domain-containing protein [Winslowiella arboricola]MCU5774746.1 helix-turn-helix transcriptional regulator [Winslowiella arboricola]MCU5780102.1 helix-turn-helix transcriptional regulator [Winslowiella arboricola]
MDSSHKDNALYFNTLIAMTEHLSEPWGIKDLESRHIYMNKAAFLYTNTPVDFAIEGKLDEEFPADWSDSADKLIEHDRQTALTQNRVAVIETHFWYGKDALMPFVSEKIPVFNDQKQVIALVWNARPLNTLSPLIYINKQKPSVLTTEVSTDMFTKSELDIIFLMLQRLSTKEIANLYDVSHKTIENRVYNIYQKAGVHTLRQFEGFCKQSNLDNYIPDRLIAKGILFI